MKKSRLKVSIGIPVHNEEKNIKKLLQLLCNEKVHFNLIEIIVVASGCTDNTTDVVRKFQSKNKKIRLFVEPNRNGIPMADNIILSKSTGNIILFVCGDNLPKKNSINLIVNHFKDRSVYAVSGRPVPEKTSGYNNTIVQFPWKMYDTTSWIYPRFNNELGAIRKGVIKKIPKNIILDDSYIESYLRSKGYKIIYERNATTIMIGRHNPKFYVSRRIRYAVGNWQLKKLMTSPLPGLPLRIKQLTRLIIEKPYNLPSIFAFLFIEFIAHVLAYYKILTKNIDYLWER